MNGRILVTGAAGFVGYHVTAELLRRGFEVVGIDDLNDYYSIEFKRARLGLLADSPNFRFETLDIADAEGMRGLFAANRFERVVHLAAQAGVRYSIDHPDVYLRSNVVGFGNVLEACRHGEVEHLVYASSSSVYGANTRTPFSVADRVDHPISLYAATKKSNELMAHSYSHLFGLPTTGLRLFTVYGPWGRPDMAPMLFANAIMKGEPIKVFNEGRMKRDFTYVGDIAEGILRVLDHVPAGNPDWTQDDSATSRAPYRVYNLGNDRSVELIRFIELLEENLGRKAEKLMLPMQAGDVPETHADIEALAQEIGFRPSTPIEEGVRRFAQWFLEYQGSAIMNG